MPNQLAQLFLIHEWKIDCNKSLAFNGDKEVRLEPKTMMILQYLASRAGEVVTRAELFELFWPNQVVTEDALNRVMSNLRRLFNEDANQPRFILTIRKVGYKVVAPITVLPATELTQSDNKTDNTKTQTKSATEISPSNKMTLAAIASLLLFAMIFFGQAHAPQNPPQDFTFKRITYDKSDNFMPDVSSDGSSIVFIGGSQHNKNTLMLRSLEKTYAMNIGESDVRYSFPVFSATKSKLAVIAEAMNDRAPYHINIINLSDTKVEQALALESTSLGLDWHPTTDLIAYTQSHIDQHNHGVYTWQPKTSKQTLITASVIGVEDKYPKFSPDGQYIAFLRQFAPTETAVFITDLNGNTTQISTFESAIYGFDWFNGQQLLVSTKTGITAYDKQGQQQLIKTTEAFPAYYDLSYSPETGKLIFSHQQVQHEGHYIDLKSFNTSYPLTESLSSDTELTISPDATSFVFVSNRTNIKSLWHRQGNDINPIPGTEFDEIYDINWSPDSRHLASIVKKDNQYGLLVFDVNSEVVTVNWLLQQPLHLIGWQNNHSLLFSQLIQQIHRKTWQLKHYQLADEQSSNLSSFDMYQARLTKDAKAIVFTDSTRKGLWRWDWQGLPEKLQHSDKLFIDRNWDISDKAIWGIDSHGSIFNLNMDFGDIEVTPLESKFDAQFRPQKRLYGLSATKKTLTDSDLWSIDLTNDNP
ncbi:winged helix-turn-helix domain-containing protein [uncultured Shewanella sp.]|uniref:winged helix-turn-helix domain-containing protein n=1 Tax=uncultured Shewanella sp. TaxID=173975 RepID=UPI0026222B2A|nr:winged helix-turn-helix domain-containing protein [uncultured Shewanella sp.]